ncbi:hypothetical protein B9Z55_004737 [Caenorhabditis nigoni]|uniref:F-box domain-containing protein n=1 Tax=Caenorhabditis nigoni TaxID=1611254 RepID=A0A2G5UY45_9PELO|nr:hypothetical protein B9Z55_004737 [Caenorhabditis nigoni]
MILSKYPRVVQNEIFNHLNYSDLFLLSFVSTNMKKLIKSSQMKRFKAIGSIEYGTYFTEQTGVYILGKSFGKLMRFREKDAGYYDFQLNVFGKMIDFRFRGYYDGSERGYYSIFVVYYPKSERQCVFESIHNYLHDFFGDSIDYVWKTDDRGSEYYIPFIPQLKNISLCITLRLDDDFADMKNLETFLSSSPIMRSIQMTAKSTAEPFNPESKLYQAQSIEIFQSDHTFPAFLSHFQGKQAFIGCLKCDVLDLIAFVKKWKSGETFRALEYLKIGVYEEHISQNEVLQEIGAKAIDAAKQPPTHTLPKIYDWEDLGPKTDPIISHTYVVRESDNRVASVLIEEDRLSFGVWDKTEEEFLRLMN